jgi:hypothetical protein
LENKLRNSQDDVVISDCRFPNEIKSIKNQGGRIIWLRRGELPSWYIMACKANDGDIFAAEKLKSLRIHASESSWAGTKFDAILDNNDTLDHLYQQIKRLVQDLPDATASHS